jgi:predicted nucleotidyltransferase
MATALIDDDLILTRVRSALIRLYGDRIERMVLFGSHARGDARADSDYDIAVFLRDLTDVRAERDRLARLSTDILFDAFKVVNAMPWPAGAWRERTPIMHEIRKDGVAL